MSDTKKSIKNLFDTVRDTVEDIDYKLSIKLFNAGSLAGTFYKKHEEEINSSIFLGMYAVGCMKIGHRYFTSNDVDKPELESEPEPEVCVTNIDSDYLDDIIITSYNHGYVQGGFDARRKY